MKIIKRSGEKAAFDQGKIIATITKASEAAGEDGIDATKIKLIAITVTLRCNALGRVVSVVTVTDFLPEWEASQSASAASSLDRRCQTKAEAGSVSVMSLS